MLTCRQADADSFHDAHFSNAAVAVFEAQFLTATNPLDVSQYDEGYELESYEGEEQEYENDDGLGYYPDGVKRTLTDDQIAIFRHSEIEALRRARDKAGKSKAEEETSATTPPAAAGAEDDDIAGAAGSEDGEIETEKPTAAELRRRKRRRAKQAKRDRKKFIPEPKEDLRKRTWDKVEAGMDSLDYDGLEAAQDDAAPNHAAQRRRISYDD